MSAAEPYFLSSQCLEYASINSLLFSTILYQILLSQVQHIRHYNITQLYSIRIEIFISSISEVHHHSIIYTSNGNGIIPFLCSTIEGWTIILSNLTARNILRQSNLPVQDLQLGSHNIARLQWGSNFIPKLFSIMLIFI